MCIRALAICFIFAVTANAEKMLKFERIKIGNVTYEAASAFDVDNDGIIDIVSGEYWFAGPDFNNQHKIAEVQQKGDYYDDFCDYPMDVNGDGYLDIITGGWWGETLRWRENPKGRPGLWKVHDIDKCGNIETIRFWDVDGDGQVEVVPNVPGAGLVIYKLITDDAGRGTGKFSKHLIYEKPQGHGLGFGDINGDGQKDFILAKGWLQAPQDPFNARWTWHPEFNLGEHASVPILVHDVSGDGKADIIAGQGHSYGLAWWQQLSGPDGKRTWVKRHIDPSRSQYHDMMLVDIDNDGEVELVTGKRYRAHSGRDPGSTDPVGVYYFEIKQGHFKRVTLDYGPPSKASGVGLFFWVADITGNGFKDILAPGKEGLFLFKNYGPLN
jgi:hypothetical protein